MVCSSICRYRSQDEAVGKGLAGILYVWSWVVI